MSCDGRGLEQQSQPEGVYCPRCSGQGEFIDCHEEICHWKGQCFHDGTTECEFCDGSGRVSAQTRNRYYANRLADRAQLTPLKTIALGVILALTLWVTLTIIYGVIYA
ncbi:hypothetical protein [Natronobacterium gregoryi]|uniref:Uncharacterized protein n=2 Tax=Natronobacterium gregoryi TaxID=44930 RepID=L0AJ49_NATGS|nr:hypothetical protein [Natronobacterium gregoryi]AFZ73080.1 hypothetical protein Natgr_1895 [Natronobacterium gregoryi SP2]ELY70819.1 hypothetical protein C490_05997 [Natronobacterium gregoryi SP2]PLK20399.1 hypothetical protein CYV19_09740 [Natronobacterium gregoryi SP2]SFI61736.1 hypothetical protein SAMN05443661_102186 [Natronobacterium gregoryi]